MKLSHSSRKGFVCHSYAGDDWRDCEEHVAGALGLPTDHWRTDSPDRQPDPIESMQRRAKRREAEEREAAEVAARQRRALAIWEAATDPRGTIIADYLRSRRLELPDEVAGTALRFHPRCPWDTGTAPAMVAALRCIHTNALVGIHRTALTADGRKVGRKMLGTAAGAAIKLDLDENVTLGLAIGEGVETCLTARQLGVRPTWALGSVDAVRGFPVVAGVEGLTVLGETGDSGASDRAAREVGTRWHREGRTVEIIVLKVAGDLNDAIRADEVAA
ncbi:toprim domain-containing protein [Methylobacterium sp. WL8]|uniref:DUF7146 domain-containing protein n=1 Tax=Methylobacterium sp. WL8 TaxID=2603899 RepID=UPI0011CA1CDB|nr:toprim domain-containing protein [Methylobacterium sp. WL8]TXN76562.1 virulence-associated protein E [Methylobacterium sp. WL8]